ncbi:MAG: hypothetical protein VB056_13965 [Sphaerochaeta associata]|uniref:hypothetical protein n=1 Tax=Sphaerochaeta associata TaxID=1129264 RepID=UPI002B21EFAD|nr:hypothetical protein [Sphaerochaeta associata]MEA5029980.1 hypothetical protein [Sphaerochaeta associata]
MRRITMRDFRWMGRPLVWEKDYRSVKLEVQAHMGLPYGPLLLAVSDESFDFEATVNVPQKGGFAGLCVYHLDSTYAAVGLNREAMEIHTTIAGSHNRSIITRTFECEEVTWLLRRSLSHLDIGYRRGEDEAIWVGSFQLPGLEKSISFGPYFANETDHPMPGWMHSIRYSKES